MYMAQLLLDFCSAYLMLFSLILKCAENIRIFFCMWGIHNTVILFIPGFKQYRLIHLVVKKNHKNRQSDIYDLYISASIIVTILKQKPTDANFS